MPSGRPDAQRGYAPASPIQKAGLDCSDCHAQEPHGKTIVEPAMCVECHHEDAVDEESCDRCHLDVVALREEDAPDDEASMLGLECIACHASVADEHSLDAVKSACFDCHEEDEGIDADAWLHRVDGILEGVEARIRGSARPEARAIRADLKRLRDAGPFHHAAAAKESAARWLALLDAAEAARDEAGAEGPR